MSGSKLNNGSISGLGLIDSNSRIWGKGASASQSGQAFGANTATYTLMLNDTVSTTSPAYPLIL